MSTSWVNVGKGLYVDNALTGPMSDGMADKTPADVAATAVAEEDKNVAYLEEMFRTDTDVTLTIEQCGMLVRYKRLYLLRRSRDMHTSYGSVMSSMKSAYPSVISKIYHDNFGFRGYLAENKLSHENSTSQKIYCWPSLLDIACDPALQVVTLTSPTDTARLAPLSSSTTMSSSSSSSSSSSCSNTLNPASTSTASISTTLIPRSEHGVPNAMNDTSSLSTLTNIAGLRNNFDLLTILGDHFNAPKDCDDSDAFPSLSKAELPDKLTKLSQSERAGLAAKLKQLPIMFVQANDFPCTYCVIPNVFCIISI